MIVTRWEQVQVGCILQWHHPQRDLTLPSGFSVGKQKAQLASLRQPLDSTSMESEVLRLEAGDVIWFLTQEPESRRNYMWFRHRATPVIPAFVRWDTCGLVSNPSPAKRSTEWTDVGRRQFEILPIPLRLFPEHIKECFCFVLVHSVKWNEKSYIGLGLGQITLVWLPVLEKKKI